jgi:hypothetical protein
MTETSNRDKSHLFDICFQFPEDEFDWELDRDHPTEWWNLFNSWLEYPEDELAWFSFAEEPASDSVVDSDMAEDSGSGE